MASNSYSSYFNPATTTVMQTMDNLTKCYLSRNIRVNFRSKTDCRPISILNLIVESQSPIVDQNFRFFHPEKTFMKKCIRLPPCNENSNADERFHVLCSDRDVICHARCLRGEPREIYLKAPCGESPEIRRFFLTIYCDSYTAKPCQIWQFYIHALQRVDVTCVLGQTSKLPLTIHGSGMSNRLIRAFPFPPM